MPCCGWCWALDLTGLVDSVCRVGGRPETAPDEQVSGTRFWCVHDEDTVCLGVVHSCLMRHNACV